MPKLTSYATATALNTSDTIPIIQSSVNKKITKQSLGRIMASPWQELVSGTDFTAAPPSERWNGSAFSSVSDWAVNTAYSLGDIRKPTTPNGFLYECVAAGTSHATTEPTWGTTLGGDTTDNTVTWRCIGAHVISTAADLSGVIKVGHALKYAWGGTTYYGVCIGISTTRIALAGARVNIGSNITAMHYGLPSLVRQFDLRVSGVYALSVADILDSVANTAMRWVLGNAWLVTWWLKHKTADGVGDPYVTPKIAGNIVSTDAVNAGTQVSTSWQQHRYAMVHLSNYDIAYGDAVELRVTDAADAGLAANLVASLVFVMEN